MALTSPGVQVSVIDESFYTPAEPGTVPMIFVATAENKANASATGTATGTLKANAGKPFLLTSQRDLADTFGDPLFKTDASNNPVHGGETNEYGLQAAYSLLGVSNRAYVVRADIDLGQLEPTAEEPAANPTAGSYWFDTESSSFGIQGWNGEDINTANGQTFMTQSPIVITSQSDVVDFEGADYTPKSSIGAIREYALVAVTNANKLWYKAPGNARGTSPGQWVEVGSPEWISSWPTVKAGTANPTLVAPVANITVQGFDISVGGNTVADIALAINNTSIPGVSAAVVDGFLEIYSDGTSSGDEDSTLAGPVVIGGDADKLDQLGIDSGTYYPPTLEIAQHTDVPGFKTTDDIPRPSGAIWLKTTKPNAGMNIVVKQWNAETLLWDVVEAPVYDTNIAANLALDPQGGSNLAVGDLFVKTNIGGDALPKANFRILRRNVNGAVTVKSAAITATTPGSTTASFTIQSSKADGTYAGPFTIEVTTTGSAQGDAEAIVSAINNANVVNVTASVDSLRKVNITHELGGEIKFVDTDGMLTQIGFIPFAANNPNSTPNLVYVDGTSASTSPKQIQATGWKALTYTASDDNPTALAEDGQLWYNSIVDEADILYHNGTTWVGYGDSTAFPNADPNGPIVAASMPTQQSDGNALVTGDIWIDTSDLENYPVIYRYNSNISGTTEQKWGSPLDNGDQTTENGVLFADARYGTTGGTGGDSPQAPEGTIVELLASNYLDPDAPDPALYPKGMLLFNLRRSGFNVKRFERNYIDLNAENGRGSDDGVDMDNYYPHRWVTESANQADGSGSFGRKAQRKVVVQALQAMLNSNDDIRDDESRLFNVMATPGYPELIGEMISLNFDRGLTAFIVGDSPMRLTPDATSINNWATNVNRAVEDNDDGLVSRDEYLGVFYPAGFTSDNFGNNVVVPPSHMMLRTIALSDQVSFPWFAPAGTRRGGVTNASASGYISDEGEFISIALNEGQRDTLYSNNVNPITFITGAGLVNYGQKTRARNASALDRINVARLVIYLRSQLNALAKPYIFEPNDKITRDELKQAAESLLLELVGQRGLYDFLVVCDESNNTPARIDRNELYLDIAIEPVKAVEFIYIPLRLKNTGEIAGL